MDGLNRLRKAPTAAEGLAALRIGGVVVVAIAVTLGPPPYGQGFFVAFGVAVIYAIALAARTAHATRVQPLVRVALIDVAFILLLIALSGGARSEARLALLIYPIAMGLAHTARSIAAVTAAAAAGFVAVSVHSLGSVAADTAFIETLAAMVIVGAIGVALASAFRRRTQQVEALGADRAALLHDALDAEERERTRIGERLHDDTLQSLLAAQQDVREARAGYLQSLEFADEALTEAVHALRQTVLGLHPASLDERGLELGLKVELDRVVRRTQLEVELDVDPEAVGLHDALLFAAARELVTNVVKHASATRLQVAVGRTPQAIALAVSDDGIGMLAAERPAQALSEGHVGLVSTRQRIEAAGGMFEVRSAPGEGTTVLATVPVAVAQRHAGDDCRRAAGLLHAADCSASLEHLARLAARLLRAPMAMVAVVDADRHVVKASVGMREPFASRRDWPLTHSLCRFVVDSGTPLVVADARSDSVLRDSLAIVDLGVIAYAGVPLMTTSGHVIGALSIADHEHRAWSEEQLEVLHDLAQVAQREIELADRIARGRRGGEEVESERRFIAAVLDNLAEGVMACDEHGELRIVNAAARRFGEDEPLALGDLAERGELRRAASGALVGRDELPLPRALRGESVAGEEYLTADAADGQGLALLLAGRPIGAADGTSGAIMTIRDVTAQRVAQRASREAEERFRVAFEHAPIGMAIADLGGRLHSVNLALSQVTGLRVEALRRATLQSLLHPDDIEETSIGLQAFRDGGTSLYATEKRIVHADGHEIWVLLQVAVIGDGAGRQRQMLVQLQDITERRREEERLRTLSERDALTMLPNAGGFQRELRRHAARVERYGADGGVLTIDIDGLEQINAAVGRGGGDDILRRFAAAVEACVRRSDFAARIGQDEFAVLVPHGDADSLMGLAEALLGRLERAQSEVAGRTGAAVTVSIGAAVFGRGATEADTVLRRAQTAMDVAFRAGGARALLFGPSVLSGPAD